MMLATAERHKGGSRPNHGREEFLLSSLDKSRTSQPQRLPNLKRSLRNQPNLLESPNGIVGDHLAELGRAEAREVVVHRLGLSEVALEGVVPRDGVGSLGQVLGGDDCGVMQVRARCQQVARVKRRNEARD